MQRGDHRAPTFPWPGFVWSVGEEGSDPIVEVDGAPFRHDQYDWQTGLARPTGAVTEVGLFDTTRSPRPVAATLAALVAARSEPTDRSARAHR